MPCKPSDLFPDKKTVAHEKGTVTHGRQLGVMGDDNDSLAMAFPKIEEQLMDLSLRLGVEIS